MEELTRKGVLEALNEVLTAVRLKETDKAEKGRKSRLRDIPRAMEERIDYIFSVAKLFVELQGCKDFSELRAIGFGDQIEGFEEDDEEDEGDE